MSLQQSSKRENNSMIKYNYSLTLQFRSTLLGQTWLYSLGYFFCWTPPCKASFPFQMFSNQIWPDGTLWLMIVSQSLRLQVVLEFPEWHCVRQSPFPRTILLSFTVLKLFCLFQPLLFLLNSFLLVLSCFRFLFQT